MSVMQSRGPWRSTAVGLAALVLVGAERGASAQVHAGGEQARAAAEISVALVESAATAAHFAALPGADHEAYRVRVQAWRTLLSRLGISSRVIGDDDLDHGPIPEPIIVLPSAAVLSDAAAQRLSRLVRDGRGLIASWQFGMYRPDGSWRGYGLLKRFFQLRELQAAGLPTLRFIALHAGSPLTAGLPAGGRVEIVPYDAPVLGAAPTPDAHWVEWALLPLESAGRPVRPTAVVHRTLGEGRVAWFNFEPSAASPGSVGAVDDLVRNASLWVTRRPIAAVDLWPGGARLAALFGLDTETAFSAAEMVAEVLERRRAPATFFCVSELARSHPATLARLVRVGEIGSHTDDHQPLAGQPAAVQQQRLEGSAAALQALGAGPVVGIRPPEERTDASTRHAAASAGYVYIAGDLNKDRSEPTIAPDGLVVLPRVPRDDYALIERGGLESPRDLMRAVRRDLGQLRRLGGLYYFSFHTQFLERAGLMSAVEELLERTSGPEVWRAEAREIAAWWRRRAGVTVRPEFVGPTRVRLQLVAGTAVPAVDITVYLPRRADGVSLTSKQTPPPMLVGVANDRAPAAHVRVEALRPGEKRVIDLDLR